MDERQAIERLKQGDIGGLEVLVKNYQTRALRAADLILRDRTLAEDVVQEAFVKVYERIDRFDPKRPFGPWFLRMVVNDALGVLRSQARRGERDVTFEEGDILADPEKSPQELSEAAEDRRRVWDALGKLSPLQRTALVQRYYLGMSEAEMAQSSSSPPGTIKRRLHDARKSLSQILLPRFQEQAMPSHSTSPSSSPEVSEGSEAREKKRGE